MHFPAGPARTPAASDPQEWSGGAPHRAALRPSQIHDKALYELKLKVTIHKTALSLSHTHTCTHARTHARTRVRALTHTCMHPHAHTCTHTHDV